MLLSLVSGFIRLATLSVFAVASLNYLFAPPAFAFRLENRLDAPVWLSFLVTGLLTTQLLSRSTGAARLLHGRARLLDLTHDALQVVRFVDGRHVLRPRR